MTVVTEYLWINQILHLEIFLSDYFTEEML